VSLELAEQLHRARGALGLEDVVERVQPLSSLNGFEVSCVLGGDLSHGWLLSMGTGGAAAGVHHSVRAVRRRSNMGVYHVEHTGDATDSACSWKGRNS